MYEATLKIVNKKKNVCFVLDFGVYSRPSTAERRRKELADLNPAYLFILILNQYGARDETKDYENYSDYSASDCSDCCVVDSGKLHNVNECQ